MQASEAPFCILFTYYTQEDFDRYVKYWKVVLVGVLNWPSEDFDAFCSRKYEDLAYCGDVHFFHDYPYKHIYFELISEKLKTNPSGSYIIFVTRRLINALHGSPAVEITDETFDVLEAKTRYLRELRRLEENMENDKDE